MAVSEIELWKPIGCDGRYEVSNFGRVRCWQQRGKRLSTPYIKSVSHGTTYDFVSLHRDDGRTLRHNLHVLVATAWCEKDESHYVVRHLDGNPRNNKASNLAWGTQVDNSQDSFRHGTIRLGEDNHRSKLTASDVISIYFDQRTYDVIATDYRTTTSNVSRIKNKQQWVSVTKEFPDPNFNRKGRKRHSVACSSNEGVIRSE